MQEKRKDNYPLVTKKIRKKFLSYRLDHMDYLRQVTRDRVYVYRVLDHSQDTLTSQKNVLQLSFLLRNMYLKKRTARKTVKLRHFTDDDLLRFPRYYKYRMAVERALVKVRLPICQLCLKTECTLDSCHYRWRCSQCRLYGHTLHTCTQQEGDILPTNQHFRQNSGV